MSLTLFHTVFALEGYELLHDNGAFILEDELGEGFRSGCLWVIPTPEGTAM